MSEVQVFEVQCAECETEFQIDSTQAGTTVHCPHCGSPSEIPTMAEIMGEEEPDAEPVAEQEQPEEVVEQAAPLVATLASPSPEPAGPPRQPKKRRRPDPSSGGRPPGRESGLVKAVSAKRSAQMLLQLSNYFYYISFFILAAWSFKVVGALYPIVNTKRGSYLYWMIESTVATAWAVTYVAVLIGLAELIKVVLYIYQEDRDE